MAASYACRCHVYPFIYFFVCLFVCLFVSPPSFFLIQVQWPADSQESRASTAPGGCRDILRNTADQSGVTVLPSSVVFKIHHDATLAARGGVQLRVPDVSQHHRRWVMWLLVLQKWRLIFSIKIILLTRHEKEWSEFLCSANQQPKSTIKKKAHKPLRTSRISLQMCQPCLIIIQSYFDYTINKPFTCSCCLICISCSVQVN